MLRNVVSSSGASCQHSGHASQLGNQGHQRQTQAPRVPAIAMPAWRIGFIAQDSTPFANVMVCEISADFAISICYGKKTISRQITEGGCILPCIYAKHDTIMPL